MRVRYDQFKLPKWLKPGKSRILDDEVVKRVYQRLGLGPGVKESGGRKRGDSRGAGRRRRKA
jgi:hypothetical protein